MTEVILVWGPTLEARQIGHRVATDVDVLADDATLRGGGPHREDLVLGQVLGLVLHGPAKIAQARRARNVRVGTSGPEVEPLMARVTAAAMAAACRG